MEAIAMRPAMTDSISEVLETMFFLPIDMDTSDETQNRWLGGQTGDMLVSQLSFKGPFSGRFYFFIPRSLAESMTVNFLGIDESDLVPGQISDTINEVINMVAGNTFSKFDDQMVFDLDVPVSSRLENVDTDGPGSKQTLFIPIETLEDRLAFYLMLDG